MPLNSRPESSQAEKIKPQILVIVLGAFLSLLVLIGYFNYPLLNHQEFLAGALKQEIRPFEEKTVLYGDFSGVSASDKNMMSLTIIKDKDNKILNTLTISSSKEEASWEAYVDGSGSYLFSPSFNKWVKSDTSLSFEKNEEITVKSLADYFQCLSAEEIVQKQVRKYGWSQFVPFVPFAGQEYYYVLESKGDKAAKLFRNLILDYLQSESLQIILNLDKNIQEKAQSNMTTLEDYLKNFEYIKKATADKSIVAVTINREKMLIEAKFEIRYLHSETGQEVKGNINLALVRKILDKEFKLEKEVNKAVNLQDITPMNSQVTEAITSDGRIYIENIGTLEDVDIND